MPFDRDKIREALGLGPDATDTQIQEAWTAAFAAPSTPASPGQDTPNDTPDLNALAQAAKKMGVVVMDAGQVDEMREMARLGKVAHDQQQRDRRDTEIEAALKKGKIPLAKADDWRNRWDIDPAGTKEMLDAMAPDLVPREAAGYAGLTESTEADQRVYALYPEMKPQAGGHR